MTRSTAGELSRRTVALWGFMGVGKSSVGRALADRCGALFVDLDDAIEEATGRSVRDLFELDGEARFREIEGRLLEQLLDDGDERPRVIALGGGALLDPRLRQLALDRWLVVVLVSPVETIAQRTRGSERPLLTAAAGEGQRARLVADLLKQRRAVYGEAHVTLRSDRAAADLVGDLAQCWLGWAT